MAVGLAWPDLDRRLVAILRGIRPEDVPAFVSGLIDAGFRAIEIPLNSPDPLRSIEKAVRVAEALTQGECLIGAGTVLLAKEVRQVHSLGGNLIVSPNANPAVIDASVSAGMVSLPGVFTATEAHVALAAGASGLKFFPAGVLGPDGIGAIRTIVPAGTEICAVGGVGPSDFRRYAKAGVQGFGLGSWLYTPSATVSDVIGKARSAIEAYDGMKVTDEN